MEEEDELDDQKEMEIEGVQDPNAAEHDLSAHDAREQSPQIVTSDPRWRALLNTFKRRRGSLPKEVASAQAGEEQGEEEERGDTDSFDGDHQPQTTQPRGNSTFFSLHRKRYPGAGTQNADAPLPVTVIPARRRGQQHTWSPQNPLLEPSIAYESRPGRSDLPVRVIPSQPQASAPWTDADLENGDRDYTLRYDPDAAALIDEDRARDERPDTGDQASWTETTDSDERNDTPSGQAGSQQYGDHGHAAS
jgi:hypothetical protein